MLRVHEDKIEAVLTTEQKNRLQQIAWQQRGPFAFKNPEVAAKLELTLLQRQQIATIIEEERPKGPVGPKGPPRDDRPPNESRGSNSTVADDMLDEPAISPEPAQRDRKSDNDPRFGAPDHMHDNFRRTIERILVALTPQQRAKWEEIRGAPFEAHLDWHPDELWLR
jgi:hypothetical protein